MKVGYARIGMAESGMDEQEAILRAEGCEMIFKETVPAALQDKPELQRCMSQLDSGDVLVVSGLDRIGRSVNHVLHIMGELHRRGVGFVSLSDHINTRGIVGAAVTGMVKALNDLQANLFRAQCQEGRIAAKQEGKKMGRPKGSTDRKNKSKPALCRKLYLNGSSVTQIKTLLNIKSYSTVYRYLKSEGVFPLNKETMEDNNPAKLSKKAFYNLKHEVYEQTHQLSLFDEPAKP